MKLGFQKGDILAILAVALMAAAVFVCFLPSDDRAGSVEIYQNGRLVKTLPLSQNQELTITGAYTNTVTIRDGAVAITHSDCPGEDCVACGWRSTPGTSIVCLPNAVELRLVGVDGDVDFVVG